MPESGYCVGGAFGLADLAALTMLGYLSGRYPILDWRVQYAHLVVFHDGLLKHASFRDTQPVAQTMEPGVV